MKMENQTCRIKPADRLACLNIYNLLQELKRTGNYEIAPEEKKEEHLIESDK